jgi:hypothetical protein
MLNLRHISPMVRAVSTMGVVAAFVGGITYAAQNSNTVMLTDNTLAASTVGLAIAGGTCPADSGAVSGTTAPGMSFPSLVPGVASTPFNFCISNTGGTALSVSMTSPTNFSTSAIPAGDVTLNVVCGTTTVTPVTLSSLTAPTAVDTTLAAGATDQCTATATLESGFAGSGGTVTPFELDFQGTSS